MRQNTRSTSILQDFERQLSVFADPDSEYAAFRRKTTTHPVLGIRLPELHAVARTCGEVCGPGSWRRTWQEVWRSGSSHEVKTVALLAIRSRVRELTERDWVWLSRFVRQVENWEHSDGLASILADLHERYPKITYPTLRAWNCSKHPWERRASLTSLLYYSAARKRPPPARRILTLVEPLVSDPHPYVQKAVGWTLRECGNVYPRETLAFLRCHARAFSAYAFSAATEKISVSMKRELQRLRRR